jgi:hypothetical protein
MRSINVYNNTLLYLVEFLSSKLEFLLSASIFIDEFSPPEVMCLSELKSDLEPVSNRL